MRYQLTDIRHHGEAGRADTGERLEHLEPIPVTSFTSLYKVLEGCAAAGTLTKEISSYRVICASQVEL